MQQLNVDNKQIQLAIVLKLQQLKREQLPSLEYQHIEDVLFKLKWKNVSPISLHDAVNDILSLSADEVVAYLSKQAIVEGYYQNINEFSDLMGGRNV